MASFPSWNNQAVDITRHLAANLWAISFSPVPEHGEPAGLPLLTMAYSIPNAARPMKFRICLCFAIVLEYKSASNKLVTLLELPLSQPLDNWLFTPIIFQISLCSLQESKKLYQILHFLSSNVLKVLLLFAKIAILNFMRMDSFTLRIFVQN